jgi:hypothetical protein
MTSPETKSPEERFNSALIKSIEETIAEVLGRNVADAFSHHLHAYLGISPAEISSHLNEIFAALKGSFEVGGRVLGGRIVRKLYAELGLTLPASNMLLYDDPHEYVKRVEEAKKMFLKE